jgi:hypothetical protein
LALHGRVDAAQHFARLGRQVAPSSAGWRIADDGAPFHFPQDRQLAHREVTLGGSQFRNIHTQLQQFATRQWSSLLSQDVCAVKSWRRPFRVRRAGESVRRSLYRRLAGISHSIRKRALRFSQLAHFSGTRLVNATETLNAKYRRR